MSSLKVFKNKLRRERRRDKKNQAQKENLRKDATAEPPEKEAPEEMKDKSNKTDDFIQVDEKAIKQNKSTSKEINKKYVPKRTKTFLNEGKIKKKLDMLNRLDNKVKDFTITENKHKKTMLQSIGDFMITSLKILVSPIVKIRKMWKKSPKTNKTSFQNHNNVIAQQDPTTEQTYTIPKVKNKHNSKTKFAHNNLKDKKQKESKVITPKSEKNNNIKFR